jgi:hypothetical protein
LKKKKLLTFENSSGIGFIHGQKDTGGLSRIRKRVLNEYVLFYVPELGENELLTPDLSLASETVNTNGGKTRKTQKVRARHNKNGACCTYSLISFSFSKGRLGFLDCLESKEESTRQITMIG